MKDFRKILIASLVLVSVSGCAAEQQEETVSQEKVQITNTVDFTSVPLDMSMFEFIEGDAYADFEEISWKESLRFFQEKGSGILYFGYDDCRFCERAAPLLNKAAYEADVPVYYVNVYSPYSQDILDEMVSYIEYTFEDGLFYVPEVLGIKNGEIVDYHVTLVDNFDPKDDEDQMSEEQQLKLLNIYRELIRKTAD